MFKTKKKYADDWSQLLRDYPNVPATASMPCFHWHVSNNIDSPPLCIMCKSIACKWNANYGYASYCSAKCQGSDPSIKEKRSATAFKKYGVAHTLQSSEIQERIKETNLKLYGAVTPLQSEIVLSKIKTTNLERYGKQSAGGSSRAQHSRRTTMLEKYGAEHPIQISQFKEKIKQTNIDKYGYANPMSSPTVREKSKDTSIQTFNRGHHTQQHLSLESLALLQNADWLHDQHTNHKHSLRDISRELGVSATTTSSYFKLHNIPVTCLYTSIEQQEITTFINSLGYMTTSNDRSIISPLELDIVIDDVKICIEYDGLFWHSDSGAGRYKRYHLNKTIAADQAGYRLVHIFSSEWLQKQDIVKSRIRSILNHNEKLYARKCTVHALGFGEVKDFLNSNHIQGKCTSSINYGLKHGDELVAVMTFGKPRFSQEVEYELLRFCSKLNTTIIGGASKLFKQFIREYNPSTIISYSDKRWNTGNIYATLGFSHTHDSEPNFYYFKPDDANPKLYSRIAFQTHKLADKLEIYDPSLSAWQNMKNNGYDRIWDCGNSVWVLNRTNII